jgi:predicted RecA/RadA family phage recombinase
MANIKKSFNFRNGVQVDDDNFIVNANGLVGIGSTIPTQSLDVVGNLRLHGTLYADNVSGQIINTSADGTGAFVRLNVGITSITSGIITSSSGIVTYYGDGSKLQNLPTSQWVDVDQSENITSIYSAGRVGIATTNPIYDLQVGGNYSIANFANGVGISSVGDINVTRDVLIGRNLNIIGISTAYSFSGFGTNITNINAFNISDGTLSNSRLPSNINLSGIITASTFSGNLSGIANTASSITSGIEISVSNVTSNFSNLGVSTSSSLTVTNNIGIGTISPTSDVHLRRSGNSSMQVTSDSGISRLIIGRQTSFSGNNGVLQFGNTNLSYPESTEQSFDIINYAPGNFNYYLNLGSNSTLGRFNWIDGQGLSVLMSLTSTGRLGIGKTNPDNTFEVVGTSTITSNSFVGGDFSVSGSINGGSLNINGTSTLKSTTINGSVGVFANSPNYTLQIGSSLNALGTSGTGVGISSSGNIVASGIITASKFVGFGSDITLLNPANISSGTISNISINSSLGIITASKFVGNGSEISNINPTNISSGTISNISINSSGIITASKFVGDGSEITNINPTNISSGTISNISINSSLGIITASKFVGNGSSITSINPDNIISGTINVGFLNINAPSGIITASEFYGSNFTLSSIYQTYVGYGTFNSSSGITTTIDNYTIPSNEFFSIEYSLLLSNGSSNYQSQTVSILGDTSVAISTEQSILYNSNKIGSFGVSIVTENLNKVLKLNITPESGISGLTTYRFVRKKLIS